MLNVTKNDIRDWQVYKLENPSGSIYVGITCNMYLRFNKYKNGKCQYQKVLYNSIKKHGFDNHKLEILDSFKSNFYYASGKEMFWIRSYMSNVSKYPSINGMNLTDGGEGNVGCVVSEETRKKQSLAKIGKPSKLKGIARWDDENKKRIAAHFKQCGYSWVGKKRTEEQKRRHSETMKGRPIWNKGIPVPDDVRKKISSTLMGRPSPLKGKPSTISLEGRERIRQANIGNKICVGRKASEETKKRLRESHLGKVSRKTPVTYFDLNGGKIKDYGTIKEAAAELGCSEATIFNYLKGKIKEPKFLIKRLLV